MIFFKNLLTILILITRLPAYAFLETPVVLPKGINSLSLVIGKMSSINQYFGSNGTLGTYTNRMSIDFNVDTLATFFPEVSNLEALLNQFGQFNIGNNLHYGRLKINVNPNISFQSLIYARGITDKWSLALGLPFAQYNLNLSMQHYGSNIFGIKQELAGLNTKLDLALAELSQDASIAVQNYLTSKGYKPLASRSDKFLADAMLVSLYQHINLPKLLLTSKTTVTLPTGPKDEANELTDITGFGETAIEYKIISEFKNIYDFNFITALGYKLNLAQNQTVRIPKNRKDKFPDLDRTFNVKKILAIV